MNPYTKLKLFNEGRVDLEIAIMKAPENIELIYLRFTVQSNCPDFLRYNSNIDADKEKLLLALEEKLHLHNPKLAKRIKNFLIDNELCSTTELGRIPQW